MSSSNPPDNPIPPFLPTKTQSPQFDIEKIKEYNSRSVDLIFDDKPESALDTLKKIELFLESNAMEKKFTIDKKLIIIILNNLACCYQKLKDFPNCISYLEAVIYHFDNSLETKHNIKINEKYFLKIIREDQSNYSLLGDFILELRFSAKFHLQMCAALSQDERHVEAIGHAKLAALMCEDNLIKSYYLYFQLMNNKDLDGDAGISSINGKSLDNNDINSNVNSNNKEGFEKKIKDTFKIINDIYHRIIGIRKYSYRKKELSKSSSRKNFTNENTSSINYHSNYNTINTNIKNNTNFMSITSTNSNNTNANHNSLFYPNNYNTSNQPINSPNNSTNHPYKIIYDSYSKYRKKEISILAKNTTLTNNIRHIFGSKIKKDDWIQLLNIGNIMYLSALNYEDLDLDSDPKYELLRDAILEKIVMVTVSYFCIATELRFLSDKNNDKGDDCLKNKSLGNDFSGKKLNGEFYHHKAVELASLFLPVSCPIVKHYISSYYKYYGNHMDIIPEGQTSNMKIELVRSEIEEDKDTLTFVTSKKIGYVENKVPRQINNGKNNRIIINNLDINTFTNNEVGGGNNLTGKAERSGNNAFLIKMNNKKNKSVSINNKSNRNNSLNYRETNQSLNSNNVNLNNIMGNKFKDLKDYDLLLPNNNFITSRSKIVDDKAPKFKLNFANLNHNSINTKDKEKDKEEPYSKTNNNNIYLVNNNNKNIIKKFYNTNNMLLNNNNNEKIYIKNLPLTDRISNTYNTNTSTNTNNINYRLNYLNNTNSNNNTKTNINNANNLNINKLNDFFNNKKIYNNSKGSKTERKLGSLDIENINFNMNLNNINNLNNNSDKYKTQREFYSNENTKNSKSLGKKLNYNIHDLNFCTFYDNKNKSNKYKSNMGAIVNEKINDAFYIIKNKGMYKLSSNNNSEGKNKLQIIHNKNSSLNNNSNNNIGNSKYNYGKLDYINDNIIGNRIFLQDKKHNGHIKNANSYRINSKDLNKLDVNIMYKQGKKN